MKCLLGRSVIVLLTAILLAGCTTRTWYESFRLAQANDCARLVERERDACLQDTRVSYDHYQRERQEILSQNQEN